jgi:hypothetical protein
MILMASVAVPAFGKAHKQPSDTADQLGQANASAVTRDENGEITGFDLTGARNVDAREPSLLGTGTKGVDGRTFSQLRSASGGDERGMKAGEMTKPSGGPN